MNLGDIASQAHFVVVIVLSLAPLSLLLMALILLFGINHNNVVRISFLGGICLCVKLVCHVSFTSELCCICHQCVILLMCVSYCVIQCVCQVLYILLGCQCECQHYLPFASML
jgi:hypothetical protein